MYRSLYLFLDGIQIPDGSVPLTPDQAAILTRLLYESDSDDKNEQLHIVLTSIANASTFLESKSHRSIILSIHCIDYLRCIKVKSI
jgi:hypothetical protein